MLKIKKQINTLYLSSVLGNLSITGAWVAILAARGFSLVEIGFAETIFHATSLICEIPSGVLADRLGRKRILIVSQVSFILACLVMALTENFAGVCISFMFNAIGWNCQSGSGDALAYDSLKVCGEESRYERYASNQLLIFRIGSGISTLCAGIALVLGYRIAYLLSVINHAITLVVLLSLKEVETGEKAENVFQHSLDSIRFLFHYKKTSALMFANGIVGAIDTLLLFFLQSKLRTAGISDWALGLALFAMELGGIVGGRLILRAKNVRYYVIFTVCTAVVILGVILEHPDVILLMTLGGFLAAAADDALQVRTNAKLQDMFPSEQRATLISVNEFIFSVIMIILSPIAGYFFTLW